MFWGGIQEIDNIAFFFFEKIKKINASDQLEH